MRFQDPYKILELISQLLSSKSDDQEPFELETTFPSISPTLKKKVIIPILKCGTP